MLILALAYSLKAREATVLLTFLNSAGFCPWLRLTAPGREKPYGGSGMTALFTLCKICVLHEML